MPSAERQPCNSGGRTLAGRLALTLALASTAAAAVATGTAMLLADRLVIDQVERSASDAVTTLAAELQEDPTLASDITAEARELGIDLRVAVTKDGKLVSGDAAVVKGGERPCTTDPATDDRVCRRAVASRPSLVVFAAVPADRVLGHRGPFALAGGAVLLLVMAASGLFGVAAARRFLAPLERLRRAVADVDASSPGAVALPPRAGLAEIDALRAAVATLLQRLDGELQRTRRFAAHAAHELRTPLTKIRIELELLAEAAHGDDPTRATLARVRETAARLERLTERLLVLATPHDALGTDQGASVSELVEALPDRIDAQHATRLHVDTPDTDGLVRGDPVLLAAMIDNVVDNALKFSDGPVHVTVREDPSAALVVVDVDDEGPGVSDARAADLFEPFAREPATSRRPGHGLGLALAAHIARGYGGRIAFVPDRRVGARVRIELGSRTA